MATSLSMVVTELCQNAVEHGLGSSSGSVDVLPRRDGTTLTVEIRDGGAGLPEGFKIEGRKSLGLSIISTLIGDLNGTMTLRNREDAQGAVATIVLPLPAGAS